MGRHGLLPDEETYQNPINAVGGCSGVKAGLIAAFPNGQRNETKGLGAGLERTKTRGLFGLHGLCMYIVNYAIACERHRNVWWILNLNTYEEQNVLTALTNCRVPAGSGNGT